LLLRLFPCLDIFFLGRGLAVKETFSTFAFPFSRSGEIKLPGLTRASKKVFAVTCLLKNSFYLCSPLQQGARGKEGR
jgi:hypothetical protein